VSEIRRKGENTMDMDIIVPVVIVLVVAGFFFWKKKSKGSDSDAPAEGGLAGGGKPSDHGGNQHLK
jgi:nitrogen fixation-related uncharacterized protein